MIDWIADHAIYLLWLMPFSVVGAFATAHFERREQVRRDLAFEQLLRDLEAQWRVRFVHGVHEYQEHEDGRRRAVRIVANGDCPLLDEWLRAGRSVEQ